MSDPALEKLPGGYKGLTSDFGSDQTIFKGVIPFVFIDIIRLMILLLVPAIALFLPYSIAS